MLDEVLDPRAFDQAHFDLKLRLLFGNRTVAFALSSDSDRLELLHGLIEGTANLRHAVFHFKGRGQFLDALADLPKKLPAPISAAALRLWRMDAADRIDRLKTALCGAHVEHFLTPDQGRQLLALLTEEDQADLPLPRFSRVLRRTQDAWRRDKTLNLPEPANRQALKAPARLCQYASLKLIYERPFRSWLKKLKEQDAEMISRWVDRAVARASYEARKLHAKGDETAKLVIASKAAGLPRPAAGSDITDFFFHLSAATASELRVQRGYESDAEKAREQAEFIDHLLCDVLIIAFSEYLKQQELGWLLALKADQTPAEQPTCSLNEVQTPPPIQDAEDWQVALYLVLHLLPVEIVGRLLHQLFKWDITASRNADTPEEERTRLKRLFETMTRYLDMHDAKFEGGDALVGCEEFVVLFESRQMFDRVFSHALTDEAERRLPKRGLREIARFGHLPLLQTICGSRQIDDETVERCLRVEAQTDGVSAIASHQQRREELHEKWVKNKHLDAADLQAYCEALAKISQHRHDSNMVNLVDHVRVHRLIMTVLGRLVDYVGLFERDLYFATLALLHRKGLRLEDLLEDMEFLLNGQIIFALRKHKKGSTQAGDLLKELAEHFTGVWEKRNRITQIRNNLAHLNMLQGAQPAPRLTHWVNQTRRLVAYDRKLKNAVSKSVIELLAREGIDLSWKMVVEGEAHNLVETVLSPRSASHLRNKRLTLRGVDPKKRTFLVREKLHSDGCLTMIAAAFDGEARKTDSIADYLHAVDWQASAEKKGPKDDATRSNARRPGKGNRQRRNKQSIQAEG